MKQFKHKEKELYQQGSEGKVLIVPIQRRRPRLLTSAGFLF